MSSTSSKRPSKYIASCDKVKFQFWIVERFDIRTSTADTRQFALEDFCSLLDLPPEAKYDGTIERIMRALRPLSTAPERNLLTILQRALFAWLIADGDMHLKNMALKLAWKDDRLKRAYFLKLAATGGINASATGEAMDALLAGFEEGLNTVSLPSELQFGDANIVKAEQMLTLCRDRLKQFSQD